MSQTVTVTSVTDMTGATVSNTPSGNKRYIRFQIPSVNGTFKIKARAKKSEQ
ncbi:MAG: hypothetical protein IJV69_00830 [Kiritimatiellae bacterium]|nr:hypothetical protein [Kiritimatiellia bacterium]